MHVPLLGPSPSLGKMQTGIPICVDWPRAFRLVRVPNSDHRDGPSHVLGHGRPHDRDPSWTKNGRSSLGGPDSHSDRTGGKARPSPNRDLAGPKQSDRAEPRILEKRDALSAERPCAMAPMTRDLVGALVVGFCVVYVSPSERTRVGGGSCRRRKLRLVWPAPFAPKQKRRISPDDVITRKRLPSRRQPRAAYFCKHCNSEICHEIGSRRARAHTHARVKSRGAT